LVINRSAGARSGAREDLDWGVGLLEVMLVLVLVMMVIQMLELWIWDKIGLTVHADPI